jgi:hypothetical protein|tara:strand:- start:993 stop:1193 length:201 start_codon:yes stop_codon:yes gene_type:complete
MSDDIDRANDHIQRTMELNLKSVDVSDVPKNTTNKCLWCLENIKEKDERRWCCAACRDSYVSANSI